MKYFDFSTGEKYVINDDYYQEILDIEIKYDYNDLLESKIINKDSKWIIELCKFVYSFKFVTLNQIKQYMSLSNNEFDCNSIEMLIDKNILKRCVLKKNSFSSNYDFNENNIFYCSGKNLVEILRNYTSIDTRKWMIRDVAKSACKILKNIMAVDFYINLVQSYGYDNIINVRINPCQRYMVLENVNIEMEFTIINNYKKECFIVEIIRNEDIKTSFLRKVLKFERYLSNDACKKSSHGIDKKPKLIFICEDKKMLDNVAKRLRTSSLHVNTTVLYTYDEILNIQFLNGKNAFKATLGDKKELKSIALLDEYKKESIGGLYA